MSPPSPAARPCWPPLPPPAPRPAARLALRSAAGSGPRLAAVVAGVFGLVAACSSAPPPGPSAPPPEVASAVPSAPSEPPAGPIPSPPLASASADRSPAGGLQAFDAGIPPLRRGGNLLLVESPPRSSERLARLPSRIRLQVEGSLFAGSTRFWAGPEVPVWVPLATGKTELFLLDRATGPEGQPGYFALYREIYGAGACQAGAAGVCEYLAVFFDDKGQTVWTLPLNPLFLHERDMEIQDIRYDGGVLFFNEFCQGSMPGGLPRFSCGELSAVDPTAGRVLWRSARRVAENVFLPLPGYLITGYGQYGEPGRVSLLRRSTGKVLSSVLIQAAHHGFVARPDNRIEVDVFYGSFQTLGLVGLDGPRPSLKVLSPLTPRPTPPSASASAASLPASPLPGFPFPLPLSAIPGLLPGLALPAPPP